MSPVFYERRLESVFIGGICEVSYPSHVHASVEIVCLQTGTIEMTVSEKKLSVRPGDIVIVFPYVPHSYETVSEDAAGLTTIFLPDTIEEFSNAFRTMLPLNPLMLREKKPAELDMLIRNLQKLSQRENSPLRLGYLHLFLSYMFVDLPLVPVKKNVDSEMRYQVLHYISEHFTEPISLESAAHALGVSRIHLSHIFSQQLHINFRQYINTLRVDLACTLLRNPSYSISQIAYLCGYGNQRTFNRAFLAQCNMSPNQYRASISDEKPGVHKNTKKEANE